MHSAYQHDTITFMKEEKIEVKKAGIVALIGRPNAGKSTLLNNLLGHKVAITSPKPQTTRFAIQALYEDERGQILFVDSPGIFGKAKDPLAQKINAASEQTFSNPLDVAVYVIDHTRERDFEENKVLGFFRKLTVPKILVFNKIDVKKPDHTIQYSFIRDECQETVEVSALTHANLNYLLNAIFRLLPEQKESIDFSQQSFPALNIDSKLFVTEIIREKVFLFTRKEVPYTITTKVDEITERDNGTLFIKGRVITSAERYKSMLIGKNAAMIKEIGMAVRKELETASGKKVFVELNVEVNPHWQEAF